MLTRRAALQGGTATVAVIAGAGAVAARVAVDDPVIALVDEIRRVNKAWHAAADARDLARARGSEDWPDLEEKYEAYSDRYWELRAEICETPARTLRGTLAKFRGIYFDWEIKDMRAGRKVGMMEADFAASVFRDLDRLAGRTQS